MTPQMGEVTTVEVNTLIAAHAADLDAHIRSFAELLRTGYYYAFPSAISSAYANVVADRLYAVPFWVARAMTFDRIAIDIRTVDVGSTTRLGIYNDGVNLAPGTLIDDSGTIDTGALTGLQAIDIDPTVLTKGLYWLALISDGTPEIRKFETIGFPLGFSGSFNTCEDAWYYAGAYGALPDPFPAPSGTQGGPPTIALRLKSLD